MRLCIFGPKGAIQIRYYYYYYYNSVPEIVISADTTDTFKRRLDKFWEHQVELTGVGNRSQINMNDNIVI